MQVAQRNLEVAYFNTGYYDNRVADAARAAAGRPGRPRGPMGAGPERTPCSAEPPRRWRSSTRCSSTRPNDVGASCNSGSSEKASGDLEQAQQLVRARPRAGSRELGHAASTSARSLYNRGLNDEALDCARARDRAGIPDNPDAHYLMGFVLGDMGRHEEARARRRSAPSSSTRRCRGRRPTSRSIDSAHKAGALPERRTSGGRRAGWPWPRTARSRTSTSASPSARRATTPRRCANTSWRSPAARSAAWCSRRWPKCTCCARDVAGGRSRLYDALLARTCRRARSSGTSAASRCTRTGATPRPRRATAARSQPTRVRDRPQQPRRRAVPRGRAPTPPRTRSAAALAAGAELRAGAAQPRAAALQGEALPAQPGGVSAGAGRRAGACRRRGTASGSC